MNLISKSYIASTLKIQFSGRVYLSSSFNVTQSENNNDIIPNLKAVAVRTSTGLIARKYTPDSTQPRCLDFTLDLSQGE